MRVFLSWSGDISRAMAFALRDWLGMIVQTVEPWMSERDIAPGEPWADVLSHELENTRYGIVCLTRDNISSPWLAFEAGALAKAVGRQRVVPLLADLSPSELKGPLSQFQAIRAKRSGVRSLVGDLATQSKSKLTEKRLDTLFEKLWPDLHVQFKGILQAKGHAPEVAARHRILVETLLEQSKEAEVGKLPRVHQQALRNRADQLRTELDRLNREEAGLRKKKATVSLIDRAIRPMEEELRKIEASVRSFAPDWDSGYQPRWTVVAKG